MISNLREDDPRHVAGHEVIGRLGEGGSGVVYEAVAPDGSRVALKVLHRELAESSELRRRLSREAEALQRVRGDRVARVLSVDAEGETPHIVMELVEGETLASIVEREPLKGPMLSGLAEGLVEALEDIHAAGIVHRDLKPSNIVFGPGGVKVVDFGVSAFEELAASTKTGILMGTPAWLSPEQARGETVGPAADIHNLGMVLAIAASGTHPYGQGRPDAMLFRIVHQQPALDGVPSALLPLVQACLAKDPDDRPTLEALRVGLGSGSSGPDGRSGATRFATDTRIGVTATDRRPRRRVARLALTAVALLAAITGGAWFALGEFDARGPLVVTYIDATSSNPQLGEAVLEVTSPGLAAIVIRDEPSPTQQRIERTGEWRLASPLTIHYLPSSRSSDGYLETVDLRRLGMDALSGGRTLRVVLTITDQGSSVDLHPARGLRMPSLGANEVQLARADEAAERRREEEAERTRREEEARREAEREREIRIERGRQEREMEAVRQQRVAEARALRNSCTTSTRALWDAQYGMVYFIESGYRSARGSLITGRSMTPYGYQLAIWSLDGIMVDNYNTANSTLSGAAGGSRINPAVTRVFSASGSLIDSWHALSRALNNPRDAPGARFSDVYPREHDSIDNAEGELSNAMAALRDAVNRDAAADCLRRYPEP